MRKKLKFLIIAFLLCVFVYVCKIDSIPTNIIIYDGENIGISNFFGISIKLGDKDYNSIVASSNLNEDTLKDNTTIDVKLFDTIKVKEVSVSTIEKSSVIPVGQVSGLKLYTNGVLVVGMSEIKAEDNKKYKPYQNTGIQEGDRIITINGKEIADTQNLIELVNKSNGEDIEIVYVRNNEKFTSNIKPIKTDNNEYKIGLWVRDTAAGIGTLTYYEPSTGRFAALGHGITDNDTGKLVEISNGDFLTSKILSIVKGVKGNPGKIQGSIDNQTTIGNIYKNSHLGIYGTVSNINAINLDFSKELEVTKRGEILLGKASILCSLDGDKAKEYDIEIEKIYISNNYDNKSMLIKVKSQELLDKTGGIIQGMSGSPIIQNGKFIGAVTNVLVNDPTQGYGVFGDIMIKEMRK